MKLELNDTELMALRLLISREVPQRPSDWVVAALHSLDEKARELQVRDRAEADARRDAGY
jgi:hypothetical protein